MNVRLGRLAAGQKQLAKKAGPAASFLIFAYLTSGCSVIMNPEGGSRFLQAIADILKLLPDSMPTSPLEFFEAVFGQAFAETFEGWLLVIVQKPSLQDTVWGSILKIASVIMLLVLGYHVVQYLAKLGNYVEKHGAEAVGDGRTALTPPVTYFPKRFLPVLLIVLGAPQLVQIAIDFSWQLVTEIATAMYVGQGQTIGLVMYDLVVGMLEGAKVWLFLFMLVFVGGVGLVFLAFYIWRYLMILVNTVKVILKTPKYLDGESTEALVEPLKEVGRSVLYLAITWFVILVGPLLLFELDAKGFPAAIGLLVVEILAIVAPWLFLRIASPISKKVDSFLNPLDEIRTEPEVSVESTPLWQRVWNRTPRKAKSVIHFGGELARQDPNVAAGMATAAAISRTLGDEHALAREVSGWMRQPHQVAKRRTPPGFDVLLNTVMSSTLWQYKESLSNEHFAVAAALVASGYGVSTIDQLKEDARNFLRSLGAQDIAVWKEMGARLKGSVS